MERVSRREALRGLFALTASGVGGTILAACSGATSPSPASTAPSAQSQATAAPTVASGATPTSQPAKTTSGEAPATLTMWKGPHKPAGDETKQIAEPTLKKFMDSHPNIKVEFTEVPWAQYNEKFTAAFAAGRGPDVSYQTESFPTFVKAGNILQLDDLMKSTSFDRGFFYPQSWTTASYNGKIYAVPWILGGSNLFWNKDLFEKAGLDPDKPLDTMDDFLNYAKKLTSGDVYGFATPSKDTHENGQWPRRFGGYWFNEDKTKCIVDSKEGLVGFQFLDDLIHKHKVAMNPAIVDQQPGLLGYFEAGKIGMITGQNVIANTIRKAKPDIKIGAARMAKGPADDPRGRACYGGAGLLAIAKSTKFPEQSWTLIQWLVTPDALKSWIAALGFMSVSPKVNYYPDDPVLSAAQDTLQYTVFWPYKEWIFKFWDIESSGIQTFVLGQRPVEDAVKDLAKKVNDLLSQQGKQ